VNKKLVISFVQSVLFFCFLIFEPIWNRHIGGPWNFFVNLITFVLGIWIFGKVIIEIVRIIKNLRTFRLINYFPVIVLISAIVLSFIIPFNRLFVFYESPIVFRACYEGTQNTSTLILKENMEFEIHSTGVFFSDNYYFGTYRKTGDTILLYFKKEKPRLIGDTMIIKDNYLYKIEKDTIVSTHYYVGNCKGEN
jgi:hypothetical protein